MTNLAVVQNNKQVWSLKIGAVQRNLTKVHRLSCDKLNSQDISHLHGTCCCDGYVSTSQFTGSLIVTFHCGLFSSLITTSLVDSSVGTLIATFPYGLFSVLIVTFLCGFFSVQTYRLADSWLFSLGSMASRRVSSFSSLV